MPRNSLKGFAEIKNSGDLKVVVIGAEPSVTYDVVYRSLDGVTELAVGPLATNPAGNANLEASDFFAAGAVCAGNIVLTRGGLDQFVTGFGVR